MPATLADIQRKYGESVYPLYKDQMHEPYMETDNGVGFKGVVLYDGIEDKIQCTDCGNWFEHLQAHLRIKHKKTVEEYKIENGLNNQIALCSRRVSEQRSKISERHLAPHKYKKGIKLLRTALHAQKLAIANQRSKQTMQFLNKHGLCPAQEAARLVVVRDKAGKSTIEELTNRDLENHDINLYQHLRNKYGSFEQACLSLGIKYIGQNKYTDSELIAKLRNFVIVNKRIPTLLDKGEVTGISDHATYRKYFGSWDRAKMMAGLDQLLKEVLVGDYIKGEEILSEPAMLEA